MNILFNSKLNLVFINQILRTSFYLKIFNKTANPSPDESGKPFEVELHFFLIKKSDKRKLLFSLGKKQLHEKACNAQQDKLLKQSEQKSV